MPILAAAIPAVIGGVQAISGMIKSNRANKALKGQKTPTYTPDRSILDYYQKAANAYDVSPYNSQGYQYGKAAAGNALASGLSALQDRRSALGGVSALTQNYNGNLARNAVAAESRKQNEFGQLGRATQMESGDSRYAFQNNQMLPYQNQRSIFAAESAGGNQLLNAGISNLNNGIQNVARIGYSQKSNDPYNGGGF